MTQDWLLYLLIGGTCFLIGFAAAWFWPRNSRSGKTVVQLEQELEDYREEVADHFVQTTVLINELSDSYRSIYAHVKDGADRILDPDMLQSKLEQYQMTKHLPQPASPSKSSSAASEVEKD